MKTKVNEVQTEYNIWILQYMWLKPIPYYLQMYCFSTLHILNWNVVALRASQVALVALVVKNHIRSLRLHLYFCPANRFTCTIFLDFTYICYYMAQYLFSLSDLLYFSFWLTLYDRLQVHLYKWPNIHFHNKV